MLFVAKYTMKGPNQALLAALLLSVLSIWFAPFGLLLGAVIALVTLRVGEMEGFKTLAVAVVANLVISTFLLGSSLLSLVAVFEYMLPIWLIALVLRKTNSLASAIHLSMLMAGIALVGFHVVVGDTVVWWQEVFNSLLLPIMEQAEVNISSEVIENIAKIATLVLAVSAVFLWVSITFIARWWQAQLYYPGRFSKNFYQIRLPTNVAYLAIVVVITSLVVKSAFSQDLAGVLIAGLLFPGLAIAHNVIAVKEMSRAWLVSLYILLFLFPQTILIIAAVGLADTWLDIRSRWSQKKD